MTCKVEDCNRTDHTALGFCNAHYQRLYKYGSPTASAPRRTDMERFMSKVDTSGDCWEWVAGIDVGTGYGRFHWRGQPGWAHRVSYELHVGPIPDGLQIDHLCRNRACVNPAHLQPVPPRVNMLRSMAPSAITVRTNRCKRGHEFTPENTYLRPDNGHRQCRECIRLRGRKHYEQEDVA